MPQLATSAILFCWLFASSLWVYPHSLSYFNESICGPLNGPKLLLGSNVDWGQDLIYIDARVTEKEDEKFGLVLCGTVEPRSVLASHLARLTASITVSWCNGGALERLLAFSASELPSQLIVSQGLLLNLQNANNSKLAKVHIERNATHLVVGSTKFECCDALGYGALVFRRLPE